MRKISIKELLAAIILICCLTYCKKNRTDTNIQEPSGKSQKSFGVSKASKYPTQNEDKLLDELVAKNENYGYDEAKGDISIAKFASKDRRTLRVAYFESAKYLDSLTKAENLEDITFALKNVYFPEKRSVFPELAELEEKIHKEGWKTEDISKFIELVETKIKEAKTPFTELPFILAKIKGYIALGLYQYAITETEYYIQVLDRVQNFVFGEKVTNSAIHIENSKAHILLASLLIYQDKKEEAKRVLSSNFYKAGVLKLWNSVLTFLITNEKSYLKSLTQDVKVTPNTSYWSLYNTFVENLMNDKPIPDELKAKVEEDIPDWKNYEHAFYEFGLAFAVSIISKFPETKIKSLLLALSSFEFGSKIREVPYETEFQVKEEKLERLIGAEIEAERKPVYQSKDVIIFEAVPLGKK